MGLDAISSSGILQTVGSGYVAMGAYPSNSLGAGLELIAQIINADLGARILYVTYGGFDTHSGEDVDHGPLLTDVSDAIKAFFDDLDGHGKSRDVLLMSWSEFGRRAQDNGSNGTDHGAAAPHFVVGDAVVPGIHGAPPDLAGLDGNGNLKIENDFRSYYGTVLSDWLGADAAAILGADWPNLGFLNASYSVVPVKPESLGQKNRHLAASRRRVRAEVGVSAAGRDCGGSQRLDVLKECVRRRNAAKSACPAPG